MAILRDALIKINPFRVVKHKKILTRKMKLLQKTFASFDCTVWVKLFGLTWISGTHFYEATHRQHLHHQQLRRAQRPTHSLSRHLVKLIWIQNNFSIWDFNLSLMSFDFKIMPQSEIFARALLLFIFKVSNFKVISQSEN